MKMEINNVITLDNDEKYIIVATTEYNNSKYHYLVGVTNNGEEIVDKVKFVEEIQTKDKLSLKLVKDPNVIEEVKYLLASNLELNEFK